MPERNAPSSSSLNTVWNRRLPLYAYLEPLFAGRRVLEIGCGPGSGAEYLATHGADRVVAIDTDPALVERARARYRRPLLEFRTVAHLGDVGVAGETFDVIIVPAADALLRRGELLAAWKRALIDGGRLLLSVTSADHRPAAGFSHGEGIGYYELSDALAGHFPRVQLFGQTPFLGFGIIEFDSTVQGLRVDSRLIEGGAEPTTHYLAVAGTEQALELGYALVQIPFAPVEAALAATPASEPAPVGDPTQNERRLEEAERRARVRLEEAEGRISELRRRADDATVQSESAMRIARAQGEEIEELRGRLRRASEDRAALDTEIGKLRRALAEADESVMSLTRRTAEEMAFVAQTLATGFRHPAAADASRSLGGAQDGDRLSEYATLRDEVDRLRATLGETEARAAAAERRLEEVAASGRERKEEGDDLRARLRRTEETTARERREIATLQERLRAAEAEARKLADREETLLERDERIARLEGEKQDLAWRMAELEEKLRTTIGRVVVGESGRNGSDDVAALRSARDRAQDEFRKAAAAHVDEVTRLKSSVAEQSALVSELEDALKVVEARADAATREAKALREGAKELEDADRTRRSRLAELEGKLLRLQHEKATPAGGAADEATQQKLRELGRERDGLRVALEQASRALNDGDAAHRARLEALERELTMVRRELAVAQSHAAEHPAGSNGKDAAATMIPVVASDLVSIEVELRDELRALVRLEGALQDEIDELGRQVVAERSPVSPSAPVTTAGTTTMAGGGYIDDNGEVILLHTTLANFRRRAARLRDETEGLRRRLESLSPSEVSGFLEELGEDLAEFEK